MSDGFRFGDTFFNQEARGIPSHPWVILSNPDLDADNVLIVNLTDAGSHWDDSCILTPDDAPDIVTKRSCIAYRFANVTSVSRLRQAESNSLLFKRSHFDEQVMQKIVDGAYTSDELIGKHRELLRQQQIID